MHINMNDPHITYSGRIDDSDSFNPVFIWAASYAHFRFYGKKAVLTITDRRNYWDNFLGVIDNGKEKKIKLNIDGTTKAVLTDNSLDAEHDILIYKRQDSCCELTLNGLELSEGSELLPAPEKGKLKLEFFGDSVSCGEVCEALDFVGKPDPEWQNGEFSNSYYSYPWQTARNLNAELHDTSQGGISLLDGIGWFNEGNYLGMESCFDKLHYNPFYGKCTAWDFSKYKPDICVIAVGQNDRHPYDFMADDYDGEQAKNWRVQYISFIEKLRALYPGVKIICLTTLLDHDKSWDRAIGECVNRVNDKAVTQFLFKRNGIATPGHPRIPEQTEMADELTAYIKKHLLR